MAKTRCDRLVTAETSKKYLAGELTAAEMYRVEFLMLENDFCFEAMEGLERVPWDHCQKAMESAQTRIRSQYNISSNERRRNTRLMAVALLIALGGLGIFWAANGTKDNAIDLSPAIEENLPPAREQVLDQQVKEPLHVESNDRPGPPTEEAITDEIQPLERNQEDEEPNIEKQVSPPINTSTSTKKPDNPLPLHIAVGRIVDPKGLALNGVSVQVGGEQSNTDESGYYTLNLPSGKMTLTLEYMGISTTTEIDSDQNWQIVLDVSKGEIIESQALNTANRFK